MDVEYLREQNITKESPHVIIVSRLRLKVKTWNIAIRKTKMCGNLCNTSYNMSHNSRCEPCGIGSFEARSYIRHQGSVTYRIFSSLEIQMGLS